MSCPEVLSLGCCLVVSSLLIKPVDYWIYIHLSKRINAGKNNKELFVLLTQWRILGGVHGVMTPPKSSERVI